MKRKYLIGSFLATMVTVLISCSPAGPRANSSVTETTKPVELSYTQVPYVFQGVLSAGSYRTQPCQVDLETGLPSVPNELVSFRIIRPNIDDNYARNLANKLGFSLANEWPLYGGKRVAYSYKNNDQSLEIDLGGGLTLNREVKIAEVPLNLPSDDDCLNIANNWLRTNNFYPSNVSKIEIGFGGKSVTTMNKETGLPGQTVHYSKRVKFTESLNGYQRYSPSASVLIGGQGKIIQVFSDLTTSEPNGMVRLKTPQAALDILRAYLARLTPIAESNPECICNTDGTRIIINKITIQYTGVQSDLMLPIFVFEGDDFRGNPVPEHFVGKVDAIKR